MHVDVPCDGAVIHVDRAGIEQVVTNLVINAAQAVGTGGNVWLSSRTEGLEYVIEVTDDGRESTATFSRESSNRSLPRSPWGKARDSGCPSRWAWSSSTAARLTVDNRDARSGSGAHFVVRLPMPAVAIPVDESSARADSVGSLGHSTRADHRRRGDHSPRAQSLLLAARLDGDRAADGARALGV